MNDSAKQDNGVVSGKRCRKRQPNRGQSVTEYVLILAVVAAGVTLSLAILGTSLSGAFGRIVQSIAALDSDLPPGTIEVSVFDEQGRRASGMWVYAFDDSGRWAGLSKQTDGEGAAVFEDMTNGTYQFLTYKSPHYYWSNSVTLPRQNRAMIKMHVQQIVVKVVDSHGRGVSNVYVYAYTANERYWMGVYGRTDTSGVVTLDVSDGDYKFRAYKGRHWYWSPTVNSPAQNSTTIDLQEHPLAVTLVNAQGDRVKVKNLYVYGYTEQGSYTGIYGKTDKNGRVQFNVPAGDYKFRVYYRGSDYWSAVVNAPGTDSVDISTGERPFTVTITDNNGKAAKNVRVHVYTGNGQYIGLSRETNKQGQVVFNIPEGSYKFRADYHGTAFWSGVISSPPTTSANVTVSK